MCVFSPRTDQEQAGQDGTNWSAIIAWAAVAWVFIWTCRLGYAVCQLYAPQLSSLAEAALRAVR